MRRIVVLGRDCPFYCASTMNSNLTALLQKDFRAAFLMRKEKKKFFPHYPELSPTYSYAQERRALFPCRESCRFVLDV